MNLERGNSYSFQAHCDVDSWAAYGSTAAVLDAVIRAALLRSGTVVSLVVDVTVNRFADDVLGIAAVMQVTETVAVDTLGAAILGAAQLVGSGGSLPVADRFQPHRNDSALPNPFTLNTPPWYGGEVIDESSIRRGTAAAPPPAQAPTSSSGIIGQATSSLNRVTSSDPARDNQLRTTNATNALIEGQPGAPSYLTIGLVIGGVFLGVVALGYALRPVASLAKTVTE